MHGPGRFMLSHLTCDAHTSDAPSQTNTERLPQTRNSTSIVSASVIPLNQECMHLCRVLLRGACHESYLELTTSLPATQIATKSRRTGPNSHSCESFLVHSMGPSEKKDRQLTHQQTSYSESPTNCCAPPSFIVHDQQ
jgi:hypothetical protein